MCVCVCVCVYVRESERGREDTGDEKWNIYHNVKRRNLWLRQGSRSAQHPRG